MALIFLHDTVSLCTALFQGSVPCNVFKGKPHFDVRQSHPALFKSWCTRCLCILDPSICKDPFWPKEIDMSFACRKTMQIRLFFQRIHLKSKVNWETVEGNLGLQNVVALYSTLPSRDYTNTSPVLGCGFYFSLYWFAGTVTQKSLKMWNKYFFLSAIAFSLFSLLAAVCTAVQSATWHSLFPCVPSPYTADPLYDIKA